MKDEKEEQMEEKKNAWNILHTLQSDIMYLLQETNSKDYQPPKHMLDMVFKHIVQQLQEAKDIIYEKYLQLEPYKS